VNLVAVLLAAAAGAVALGPSPSLARLRRVTGSRVGSASTARSAGLEPTARRRTRGRGSDADLRGRRAHGTGAGVLTEMRTRRAAAVLLAVSGGWVLGGSAGLVVAPVLGATAWAALGRLESGSVVRSREQTVKALPLAAELLAAAVSAGSPPVVAADVVGSAMGGPLGAALKAAAASVRVGVEPASAWLGLATNPALRPLARALAGAVTRGASPIAVLQRVAQDARDSARWAAEARARSLGAKAAAPLGLCFLPAFVLVGIVPVVVAAGPLLP
jgi:Flp pilus assembly protein TadB